MHFSLDFWNTIAQPNPEYSYQRNLLLSNKFGIHIDNVSNLYTGAKQALDKQAEVYGIGVTTGECYNKLALLFCDYMPSAKFEVVNKMRGLEKEFQSLFIRYQPHINKETINTIKELHSNGHTFSITSNTNFIKGRYLLDAIDRVNLSGRFEFTLFSDELGLAKPNPLMFEYVATCYTNFCETKKKLHDKIIHIGDHQKCDAPKIFDYKIIRNTSELSQTLKEIVKNEKIQIC